MYSFKSTLVAVATAFVASAYAQKFYDIDPDSVSVGVRVRWCSDQTWSCPTICAQTSDGDPLVNDCDSDALRYGCICSDGLKPNMSEYSLTLPFHMCMEWGNQCVANCGLGNNQCSSDCREQNPCGAQNPERVNTTSTSASATPDPTASSTSSADDGIFTGMDGANGEDEESDSDSSQNAATVLEAGRAVGLAVVLGGLLGTFALAL